MSFPKANGRRRLWLVAFGGSVAVHAALFLAAGYGARHARPLAAVLRPIEITVLAPPPVAAQAVEPVQAARPRPAPPVAMAAAVSPSLASSEPATPVAVEAPIEPGRTVEPAGPRRLTLFPSETLGGWQKSAPASGESSGHGDAAGPALSADEDAKARVDAWGRAFNEMTAARVGGAGGSLGAFEAGVVAEFRPSVDSLRQAGRFGIGALSVTESYLDTLRRQRAGTSQGDPSTGKLRDSQMFPPQSELSLSVPVAGSFVSICMGTCGDESHLVSALAVTIRILHDDEGRPRDTRVLESSGDPRFDAEAVSAIDAAATSLGKEALSLPPVPVVSEWELSAKAYRWSRMELLLDPLFVPPGEVVEAESGVLGKTTVVREVRLVAVAYAPPGGR